VKVHAVSSRALPLDDGWICKGQAFQIYEAKYRTREQEQALNRLNTLDLPACLAGLSPKAMSLQAFQNIVERLASLRHFGALANRNESKPAKPKTPWPRQSLRARASQS